MIDCAGLLLSFLLLFLFFLMIRRPPISTQGRSSAASDGYKRQGWQREQILRQKARECGSFVVYVNGVGGQDELVFDGHSLVIDPGGELVCRAPQFAQALLLVEVDTPGMPSEPSLAQSQTPAPVSYTHLRAHETVLALVCRLLLEKKK